MGVSLVDDRCELVLLDDDDDDDDGWNNEGLATMEGLLEEVLKEPAVGNAAAAGTVVVVIFCGCGCGGG